MIFIILFLIVLSIIVTLNFIDSSNIKKIEHFLEDNNCTSIEYFDGKYQALCQDEVLLVDNKFSIHLDQTKRLKYDEIKSVETDDKKIILNDDLDLKFKSEENQKIFYKKLKDMSKE